MTTATFLPDLNTNYANPGRGWHFQSGNGLNDAASMDLPNFAADAAGLPTPLQNVTLNNVETPLGSGLPTAGNYTNWQTSFNLARSTGIMFGLRFLSTGNAAQIIAQCQAIQANGILLNNRDVIAYVQCGFRCDFGEWADNCTDNNNNADKTNIFNAIVAMVPSCIPIEFTQVFEREQWFGAPTPTTLADMLGGSVKGRTGFHSDCFLTGVNGADSSFYTGTGSFTGFTSTMTFAQQGNYMQSNAAVTQMGAETCNNSQGAIGPNGSMRKGCGTQLTDVQGLPGGIENEAPRYGLVHINGGYEPSFLASWSAGGCLGRIANMMGYRFQYDSVTHSASVARGGTATFDVFMRNYGWNRIYDQRRLHVILVNGGTTIDFASSTQLRELPAQATSSSRVQVNVPIPAGVPPGTYAIYLKCPSPFSTTQANAFTVRTANANNGAQIYDVANARMPTGTTLTVT